VTIRVRAILKVGRTPGIGAALQTDLQAQGYTDSGKGVVGARNVERQLRSILETLPQDAQGHAVAMMAPPDIPAQERTARRQQLEARINRLGVRFEVGEITETAYRERLREIRAEIDTLEAPSASRAAKALLERIREVVLRNLAGAWPERRRKDPDGFRSALSQVLQAVYVDTTTKRIVA